MGMVCWQITPLKNRVKRNEISRGDSQPRSFLCMGVVFYQKIADNAEQSSVSSKPVN
jgi:hypothetical protein